MALLTTVTKLVTTYNGSQGTNVRPSPSLGRTTSNGFLVKMTLGMHRTTNRSAYTSGIMGHRFGSVITRGYVGYRIVRPRRSRFSFARTSQLIHFNRRGSVTIVKRYLV